MNASDLYKYIKNVVDYPTKGINFKDITPLLANNKAYKFAVDEMVKFAQKLNIDVVVSPEARGFLFGCVVAYTINAGFIPARKKGKLPRPTIDVEYEIEYGHNILSIHKDSIKPDQRILIIDDLLATGGTIAAIEKLVNELKGCVVGYCFLINLKQLNGINKLNPNLPCKYLLEF